MTAPPASALSGVHPSAGEALLSLRGVTKAFDSNVVFRGTDLDVYEGETLAIIGPSGCGKSVALKLMIGLLTQDEGTIQYKGRDVTAMNALELRELRRDVSMVFQAGALFDSMTVLENVSYSLVEHTKMGDAEMRDRVVECLTMVGLAPETTPGILEKHPANLSGGMQKRVALARSIALKPSVILYDEPTMGLDPPNCDRIAEMIKHLQTELKVTSVVVTHDLDTAWFSADRVAIVLDKRFPFVAPTAQFREIPDQAVRDFIVRKIL